MHGRLKVKTTAEQEEAKRKEREKKLKLYKAGTSTAFTKREKEEFDGDILKATSELLSANPDFYTLWNIRRETFIHIKQNESSDDLQSYLDAELGFLEQCLRVNPKSYGTWHHRGWVLITMPQPDWKRELQLCNKFLEYDERNFHCWDYRRLVIGHTEVSAEDELAFTTNKIETNFSNYSSWHYRSKLLPKIWSDPEKPGRISSDQLVNECMLAQNAFFTDPSDQSAWFYHRWLLGRVESPLRIECAHVSRHHKRIVVSLSRTIKLGGDVQLTVDLDGDKLPGDWQSATGEVFSQVWFMDNISEFSDLEMTFKISLSHSDTKCSTVDLHLEGGEDSTLWQYTYKPGMKFCQELSAVTSDLLILELESLQQLHDLEPDNKWVLLTIVSVMRALDPLKYDTQATDYINKLMTVDPGRHSYYLDLKSKYKVENAILSLPGGSTSLDLSGQELTCLSHAEHLVSMEIINLSHNALASIQDGRLLQCVRQLRLDGNSISSCKDLRNMGSLSELSLCDNNIGSVEDLQSLRSCPRLQTLHLKNNPVCQQGALPGCLPGVDIIC